MIVSASRRTDIPGFYAEWFMNRLRAGYVLVRNPFNSKKITRVPLTAKQTDCIVFWTKDPAPLLPHLDEIERMGHRFYFQFTLTPYGRELEPGLRDKAEIVRTFCELGRRVGRERLVWRYDPILLGDGIDTAYHRSRFLRLCDILAPYTDTVTVSFVDIYKKLRNPAFRPPTQDETNELAANIGRVAADHGLRAAGCCEDVRLADFAIDRASCIDPKRIQKLTGRPPDSERDRGQRPGCGCCSSVDIGAYDSCVNGCAYCYATKDHAAARRRFELGDVRCELLGESGGAAMPAPVEKTQETLF